MGYRDKTYIIFDADKDYYSYSFMKGWKSRDHMDFDFEDAHEVHTLTRDATDEGYIKTMLKKRFVTACQVIVLIGKSTKNLYRYVRWELEVAQSLNLPIIAVNLNDDREQNDDTCPPIIRDTYVLHIPFRMAIIKYALDNFPTNFKTKGSNLQKGGVKYDGSIYRSLGLY